MKTTANSSPTANVEIWPALPYDIWKETLETLQLWTQIVGKVRLTLSPFVNHWWHTALYITARGLTTSPIPYQGRSFEVIFDFIEHNLLIVVSDGTVKALPLLARSVAAFYREFMAALQALDIYVSINTLPCEIANPLRFDSDEQHASYDPLYANRFWRILVQTHTVMQQHRTFFTGKASPIHFFWGSSDLALTFFSGRPAPERPGADSITREAYSQEVISFGFWPGNAQFPNPAFYSYTSPVPAGLAAAHVLPDAAFYSQEIGEFLLRYDDVRSASDPVQTLLSFFQSAYVAGVNLAKWDRKTLERKSS